MQILFKNKENTKYTSPLCLFDDELKTSNTLHLKTKQGLYELSQGYLSVVQKNDIKVTTSRLQFAIFWKIFIILLPTSNSLLPTKKCKKQDVALNFTLSVLFPCVE